MTRICQSCDKPFAARDRYEQYCRICRRDIVDPRASSRRGEWMKGLLLLLLLLPSAFLVERVTGLWSSGYAALKANAPAAFMEDGRFQCGHAVYIMPAAALSVALAAGIAWAVGALFMLQVRRRG